MLIVFQIDALRHDYIDSKTAPFISCLAQRGLSADLVPTFGFEPDFAYLAGLYPDEANGGAQFIRSPATSCFRSARFIPEICNRLPRLPQKVLRKGLQRLACRDAGSPFVTPAMIPFSQLPCFDVAMRRPLDAANLWPRSTVFDLLRATQRPWLSHWAPRWRVDITAVVERADRELHLPLDLAFFHVGNLDRVGHAAGPDSIERRTEMTRVDAGVRQVYELARQRFPSLHILVFGDHGMVSVQRSLNVSGALAQLAARPGRDYEVFLDSTMARFWFFSDTARREIRSMLSELTDGRVLSSADLDHYHLKYIDNRFGDLLYVAAPGVLVSPNYYQGSAAIRGMHGYLPEVRDQQSAMILHGEGVRLARLSSPVDMRRLFPTMLDLLELPQPAGLGLDPL